VFLTEINCDRYVNGRLYKVTICSCRCINLVYLKFLAIDICYKLAVLAPVLKVVTHCSFQVCRCNCSEYGITGLQIPAALPPTEGIYLQTSK